MQTFHLFGFITLIERTLGPPPGDGAKIERFKAGNKASTY